METMYLVSYFRHNASTGGVAYKTELATTSLDAAKEKFHALCGEYFNKETFDFASVAVTDNLQNVIMKDYYQKVTEPITDEAI